MIRMPLADGALLIDQAAEEERKRMAWEIWVASYPHMERPISFDEFYRQVPADSQPAASVAEVIAKAERIKAADQAKGR